DNSQSGPPEGAGPPENAGPPEGSGAPEHAGPPEHADPPDNAGPSNSGERTVSTTYTVEVLEPLGEGETYISDLPWSNVSNGWGPIERDQEVGGQGADDGTPITIDGAEYAKGIGAHAPSSLDVLL